MFKAQDLLGQLMQSGVGAGSARGGHTTGRRIETAMGPQGVGRQGGMLEQIMGGLQQGGGRGVGTGGGLGGLLGGLQGALGGGRPGQANPLAVGGLGALAGVLLGRGKNPVGNAIGGAGLAMLGTLAMQALQKMGEQKAMQQQQAQPAPAPEQIPIGVRPPETPAEEAALENKATILLQAMISAAKADGQIDGGEVQRILGKVQEGGADADAIGFLQQEMKKPLDLDGLVAQVRDPELAAEVYAASLLAIEVDTPAERDYLRRLAQGLRLDPVVTAELHGALGAPPVA
jgi:uncharacterized membrane protein YebE (DUF533 family)